MPETELWIWVVISIVAVIAFIISIGNHLHNRRMPSQDEYQRAQEALKTYEYQQQCYEDQQKRAEDHLDRQEALLDRIELLLDRLEKKFRA